MSSFKTGRYPYVPNRKSPSIMNSLEEHLQQVGIARRTSRSELRCADARHRRQQRRRRQRGPLLPNRPFCRLPFHFRQVPTPFFPRPLRAIYTEWASSRFRSASLTGAGRRLNCVSPFTGAKAPGCILARVRERDKFIKRNVGDAP